MKRRRLIVTAVLVLAGVAAAVGTSWSVARSTTRYKSPGEVLVSADGRTLAVSQTGCGTAALDVRESRTAVTVRLRIGVDIMPAPGACAIRSFTAQLAAPVGSRRLVDGVTGKSLPAFDGKGILRPARLPPGFVHRYDTASLGDETVRNGTVGCVQLFTKGDSYDELIWISQDIGATWQVPDGVTETPVQVRGHPGTAIPGEIEWTEAGQMFTIRSMTYAYATLSTAQLLAIADSMG
jgi:hypothetical protein